MSSHDKNKQNNRFSFLPKFSLGLVLSATLMAPMGLQAAVWLPEELAVVDLVNLQRSFHNLDSVQRDDRLHDSALAHSQSMADYNFFSHTTLAGPDSGSTPADRISDGGYDYNGWGENIAAGQGRAAPLYNTPSTAIDAARDVMYGTEDFNEINDFFTSQFDLGASGWDTLGVGLDGSHWDAWYDETGGSGGWMGSAGHRNTILNGVFDDLGVGYVWDGADIPPIQLDSGTFLDPLYTYWTQHFAFGDSVEEPAPVPLPGAFWLLGSGLLGMVWVGRRREESV
ncbi:MAG: CAP domain-containing protein [Candidatus Thiodiazotropha lotti]|uniref:SCP domain-containing protein n=1 Tax=Candidatus Thiodiazotropha endoloripes TaxID=1818881 RepID=A0A1E2UP42_9GAMM|nr:CAP domain-containing protein [Candidatus Thiodiazotropha endoloripes]MCG7898346.1 CAP domain-containing protein [Candidatus Thiodiazotropha weberae]MCG7993425.1 CAP domain-containing protein [Candidatus Thiodiazotropha lotti]MCG7901095.1 CAP domain-containing protein [Candidatus Thiodiazotropha weberae]MCG7913306.1 CAP domain-containing protein [Candidatus Thiodiazotropha weberae]MCG7998057.1 CAP domain-containing protein [Candidatus Thiodiazotropha lotti]